MATYVPNASDSSEPLITRKAKTAAEEFRGIKQFVTKLPNITITTSRTLALTDAGARLVHKATDVTPRVITVPTNAAVAFPEGTVISFLVMESSGTLTFAPDVGVTVVWTGNGASGSRSAPEYAGGFLELIDATNNIWYLQGSGVA